MLIGIFSCSFFSLSFFLLVPSSHLTPAVPPERSDPSLILRKGCPLQALSLSPLTSAHKRWSRWPFSYLRLIMANSILEHLWSDPEDVNRVVCRCSATNLHPIKFTGSTCLSRTSTETPFRDLNKRDEREKSYLTNIYESPSLPPARLPPADALWRGSRVLMVLYPGLVTI